VTTVVHAEISTGEVGEPRWRSFERALQRSVTLHSFCMSPPEIENFDVHGGHAHAPMGIALETTLSNCLVTALSKY
jgi:hypothetical protein